MSIKLSNEQKEELKNLIEKDGYDIMSNIENYKAELAKLVNTVDEQFNISPKVFKKTLKIWYKENFEKEKTEFDEMTVFYKTLFN